MLNLVQQSNSNRRAGPPSRSTARLTPAEEERVDFVKAVLADTEDVWNDLFREMNTKYQKPKLVLFTDALSTEGCGFASSAVGPFYCPGDEKVYLDLGFFQELKRRFLRRASSPQAYVIAHEVGHHVQNLLGISDKVRRLQARALARRRPMGSRCGWSSRPTSTPASGPTTPRRCAHPRAGRRRVGPPRGDGHRRRPPPERGPGICRPRLVHPRHVGAAGPLVPPRAQDRRHQSRRHVQRRIALANPRHTRHDVVFRRSS